MDEIIDIVDTQNNLTGETISKEQAHKEGILHRSAHIWIYNEKGEVIIQLRQKDKTIFPDKWDTSAAGHISAGEEPITSAVREVQEELGINLKEEDLELLEIHHEKLTSGEYINNEFYHVYITKSETPLSEIKIQTEEVQEAKWISIEELEEDYTKHPEKYVPSNWYWTYIIKEIKKRIKDK